MNTYTISYHYVSANGTSVPFNETKVKANNAHDAYVKATKMKSIPQFAVAKITRKA